MRLSPEGPSAEAADRNVPLQSFPERAYLHILKVVAWGQSPNLASI